MMKEGIIMKSATLIRVWTQSSERRGRTNSACLAIAFLVAACGCLTSGVALAEFLGKKGYTVVFAFSESTERYGWGWNADSDQAAATALQSCGIGAKVVCFKTDGYLCLVWRGSKFAWGHSTDRAQNAYGHALESFQSLHGGNPSNIQCRSSDGDFIPVN